MIYNIETVKKLISKYVFLYGDDLSYSTRKHFCKKYFPKDDTRTVAQKANFFLFWIKEISEIKKIYEKCLNNLTKDEEIEKSSIGHSDVSKETRMQVIERFVDEYNSNARKNIRCFIENNINYLREIFPVHINVRRMESRIYDWTRKSEQQYYTKLQEQKSYKVFKKPNNLDDTFDNNTKNTHNKKVLEVKKLANKLTGTKSLLIKSMVKKFEEKGVNL